MFRKVMTNLLAIAALVVGLAVTTAGNAHAQLTTRIQSLNFSAAPTGIYWIEVPHDGDDWVVPAQAERWVDFTLSVEADTTRAKYKITRVFASLGFQGYAGGNLTAWEESQLAVPWIGSVNELDRDFQLAAD